MVRAWESFTGWFWFATEKLDGDIWFGFVQGIEEEWGNFRQSEIEGLGVMAWEIPAENLPWSGRRQQVAEVAR